jgi:hypothetical protein
MSFCKIWTKCDLDDYEAGSFVKNDLNNSNNFWCGKNYITIQCTGDVLLLSTPMQEIRNTDFRSSFLLKSALYC